MSGRRRAPRFLDFQSEVDADRCQGTLRFQPLREPVSDELPCLVRLIGLDVFGTALGDGEHTQLLVAGAGRVKCFASVVDRHSLIVLPVQNQEWLLQMRKDVDQGELLHAF